MDAEEVEQLAEMVNRSVAPVGNMTSADLARKAGVSDNTLAKIKRGEAVTRRSAEKVRAALGGPPVIHKNTVWPEDIELVRDMVGAWLLGMHKESRASAVVGLVRFMGEPPPNGSSAERLTWLRGH